MGDALPQSTMEGKVWKVGACRKELVAEGLAAKAVKGVKSGAPPKAKTDAKPAPKARAQRPHKFETVDALASAFVGLSEGKPSSKLDELVALRDRMRIDASALSEQANGIDLAIRTLGA